MKLDASLRDLATQIERHARTDGEHAIGATGIKLLRMSSTGLVQRGILRPSFCMVAQGMKIVQAGADTTLSYGAGNFLASSIDMPLVGQVVEASKARPYLAVLFELGTQEVLDVLREVNIHIDTTAPASPATFVGNVDAKVLDVVRRTVASLDDGREARFLTPLLKRELIFRLVTGPNAFAVVQSALVARVDDGIGRAVDWLRSHYKRPLEIEALAKLAKMSTSSLHHKFKASVMMGPLQYQKRLRLEEARRLLLRGADATTAAFDVGYESASQFSREYRRLFGLPPRQDVKRMRDAVQ